MIVIVSPIDTIMSLRTRTVFRMKCLRGKSELAEELDEEHRRKTAMVAEERMGFFFSFPIG